MYRTFVILRHTFIEAVVQPIFSLLLGLGALILIIFGMLPFFTLGEDIRMYNSVGLDVILLLVLIGTLFATSRSIYEEIEDRTMLTLMSKPVSKWEVLVGKYLGIVCAALLAIAVMGAVFLICSAMRLPGDYTLNANSLDDRERSLVAAHRLANLMGLLPGLVLVWMQIAVLAAIGVALSTRFSLVANLPIVILIYIAGNLTRFLSPGLTDGQTEGQATLFGRALSAVLTTILPFLRVFDAKEYTVFSPIAVAGTPFAADPKAITVLALWGFVAVAAMYAVAYVTFALSAGMLLFQNRELGGAEG